MVEKKTPKPSKPAKKVKKASASPASKTAKKGGAAASKKPAKRTTKAPALEKQVDLEAVDENLEADADIATRKSEGRAPVILVGIGSSAGGLEALKELVASLPTEQNLSYVIAQHLSPTHTSLLQELLRPETELGVGDLKDGTIPQPNTIYVTPPNQDVVYANGMLRLNKPQASVGPKPSVDLFLKSLAENHGDNTVAIILSGTGSDGAAGVRAVKAAGGVVLVQDPQMAKYDGMPRAAIQTSCADLVLAASKMGEVLSGIAEAPANMRLPVQEDEVSGSYAKIASGVKRHTGFDLTHYKFATVNRRLIRRMSLHKSTSFDDYAELVRSDREEAHQMVKDVLISVTSFFRDEEAFDALQQNLRKLVAEHSSGDVIRIWIAGCATGEEAYTMAIMMSEAVREHERGPEFLIFATDLDAPAVNFARNGAYPEASVEQLPKHLVETYFEHTGKVYQVRKFLRQNMVFAVQNLIEDPPFSRMDLISCRNLLIYLTRPVQRRVLEVFHYALKANGLLFLGKSESIELHKELFADLDKKAKLFKRQATGGSNSYSLPTRSRQRQSVNEEPHEVGGHRSQDYQSATYQLVNALADNLCPPAVVISDQDDAMHFVGELKPFLRFPRGPAELKIFDLVHEPIRGELRALIHRARRENSRQQGNVFSVEIDGEKRSFTPTVNTMSVDKKAVVVLYFEPAAKPAFEAVSSEAGDRDSLIIDELERELANTRQHLQTVVEELETSNEELLSQSEELQSANEELQSTNEELQTSNEELQSTNEELLTVNDELQSKSQELALTATNLQSVKESMDFSLLVVDERLHVTHFNRAANSTLPKDDLQPNLSLASTDWHFDLVDVLPHVRDVLRTGVAHESTITFEDGRVFTMRAMPSVSNEQTSGKGAVLTFIDVSDSHAEEHALREREAMYRLNFELSPLGMALIKPSLQFTQVNAALARMLGYDESELLSRTVTSLCTDSAAATLQSGLNDLLTEATSTFTGELQLQTAAGETSWASVNAVLVRGGNVGKTQIALQIEDINSKRMHNRDLQREHLRLRLHAEMLALTSEQSDPQKLLNEAVDAAFRYYPECRFSVCVPQGKGFQSVYSRQPAGVASIAGRELDLGPLIAELGPPGGAATLSLELPEPSARGILGNAALPRRKDIVLFDGSRVIGVMSMEHRKNTEFSEDEQTNFASLCELLALKIRDATSAMSQSLSSQSLVEHKFRLETALNSIADGIITTDPHGQVDYMNPAAVHLTGHRQGEAIGQHLSHIFKLVAATDNRPVTSPIATALADKKIVDRMQQDCFLVHKEGRKSVVQCSAAPFVDGEDRVTGGILVFRDVTDQNLLAAELSFRASHDPLTGLINRDEFDRRLKTATVEARRTGQTHVICYLDIDQFKVINDTCGHTAGDELLKQLAELLRSELRQSDTLARLGGDEFGILMSNCDLGRGEDVVKGLLVKVREFRFNWQEAKFRPRVSIGVVSVDKDSKSVATILSQVDAACFTAKEAGRDRYYVATGADDTTIRQHGEMQLVSKIAHALEHDLFQLKLEDVVELDGKQRKVFYREVLLRLDGDDGKPMDINEIVPAAERYLLMSSIDRWVVRRTLGLLAKRQDKSGCIFAINLSGQTLGEEQSLSFILRQIEEFDVDPSRLCFEITETAAVTHLSEAVRFMETLSEKGVQFALDDFGSGLASFAYLKQLPVQFLKIDGSFVRGLPENNFDRTMVAAIQRIGEEIGLKTIAEHAETETIITALEDLGIRYIQGYALGEGEFLTA